MSSNSSTRGHPNSEGVLRSIVADFYSSILHGDLPEALNDLIQIQESVPNSTTNGEWCSFLNGYRIRVAAQTSLHEDVSTQNKVDGPSDSRRWSSQYGECLQQYQSGNFDCARRVSYDFLFHHRFDMPQHLRSVLQLGGLDMPCTKSFMYESLVCMIILFAAIEYRVGHIAKSKSICQLLAQSQDLYGEITRLNADLVSNRFPSFGDIPSISNYKTTNQLVYCVKSGDFNQARNLLEEIKSETFVFKGHPTDLAYIHELLGEKRKDLVDSLGVVLLTARKHFSNGDSAEARQCLMRAMKMENMSLNNRLIVNYNLAYIFVCESKFKEAVKLYELHGVAIDAPPFVLAHYCAALILSDQPEKVTEFMQKVPSTASGEINLMMAKLYCSRNEWEFGLLRLIESKADWFMVKQIILAFLISIGRGRIRYGEFEGWNNVVEGLIGFLNNREEHGEANILCQLVEQLRLPTLVNV